MKKLNILNKSESQLRKFAKKEYHLFAKAVVHSFIKQREKFTEREVNDTITSYGGILRVSICVPVSEYLEDFEKNKTIKFQSDEEGGHYIVLKKK